MDLPGTDGSTLTMGERAAARAFVARCEIRLSTFHRIAVGMLPGAGLLVVLSWSPEIRCPAFFGRC